MKNVENNNNKGSQKHNLKNKSNSFKNEFDNDLARENLENDIPSADLQD